jgi:5'(3')-deoxyribonucleotidase
MERSEIIKLSKKNIPYENLEKAKKILEKDYEISYGNYEKSELLKAIHSGNPFVVEEHLVIGFEDGKFIDSEESNFPIEKMVKAVIIEDVKINEEDYNKTSGNIPFAIIGRSDWIEIDSNGNTCKFSLSQFNNIIGKLCLGEIFLPAHSAVFNFLVPSEEFQKKKIVSMLVGANINIYSQSNYIDNCLHEMGHLFWRTVVLSEEKEKFKALFKIVRPTAIYEYDWERHDPEEMFCTIYKWYLKSILINKSFYNILEYEEPNGLASLQKVFERIANDKMINDIWESNKNDIFEYLNPRYNKATGQFLRKAGMLEKIQDIEIPRKILNNNIIKVENGIQYIKFEKAIIPVNKNKIIFSPLEKATPYANRKQIFFDMDGVVCNFAKEYKNTFLRDAYQDDPFTIHQAVISVPSFFRNLQVIEKGRELFNLLKDDYIIIFLTTPCPGMDNCKHDKIYWIKENFGEQYTVIFSDNKEEYVIDETSILIDDTSVNLDSWTAAGGTAVNFNQRNDKIIEIIKNIFYEKNEIKSVKKQLEEMEFVEPTEKQKENGNYKKGKIIYKNINISIENPKGSWRFGLANDGKPWASKMKAHYGYITGSDGTDNEPIDCYIGPKIGASRVFIINQGRNNIFDEVKIILGCETLDEARKLYLSNYRQGWEKNILSIIPTNTKKLREWIKNGNTYEPYS